MTHLRPRLALVLAALVLSCLSVAQSTDWSKLSALVRKAVIQSRSSASATASAAKRSGIGQHDQRLTAFVRTTKGTGALEENGCEVLASFGDIHIASIPISRLAALSLSSKVSRIEASERCSVTMDSLGLQINALPVYAGQQLPQAYTGRGVVMGIQDIGFDLTCPNFYSADLSEYRIKALWDQLSTDTVGASLYVGRDYVGQEALLAVGHSRDGLTQTHGTHTLGIAAGSGYTSPYRGVAYESDICLVANAAGDNSELIADEDQYKYTTATDALGFKYIFDYAEAHGQPCVVSFSEGYHPDFYGDDQLYFETLSQLTGPGRILVASAGNESLHQCYFKKAAGVESCGAFVWNYVDYCAFLLRSNNFFDVRLVAYGDVNDTITVNSRWAYEAADSMYVDTLRLSTGTYIVTMAGYPSCYDATDQAYEMVVRGVNQAIGQSVPVSLELVGRDAEVEWFRYSGFLKTHSANPALTAGERTHNILSPGAAPAVICVGASSYRQGFTNYKGDWKWIDYGKDGVVATYSSVGPTLDGHTKPDVIAPGSNIISSYSSYYMENKPMAGDLDYSVEKYEWNGRTYAWTANQGTSMSTPAVGGAIALWLQACPTLTPDDVRAVLDKTCANHDASLSYPNNVYGYGELDAYAGLLEVLNIAASIPSLSRHQPAAVTFALQGETLTIGSPRAVAVRIYSTSGHLLFSAPAATSVDLSTLPRGVLAVQVTGSDAQTTGSTLIRH